MFNLGLGLGLGLGLALGLGLGLVYFLTLHLGNIFDNFG